MGARSLDELAAAGILQARFHAGASPSAHHWTLEDAGGQELARTRRVHSGGMLQRAVWKTVTLTGLDSGNDIHVELVGADDAVLARASSFNAQPRTVAVTDAAGLSLARTTNADGKITLESGDPGRVLATVEHSDGDEPWPVIDPDGAQIAELLVGDPASSDTARTVHLGLRRVVRYTLAPAGDADVPVGVALLPLLAGLTY